MNLLRKSLVAMALLTLLPLSLMAGVHDQRFDIYFIDVEGGAANLIVTPTGESILLDSGYPDNHGRDRDRILKVVREAARLSKIDYLVATHWHSDHYGNHAALAAMFPVVNFLDRGIPPALPEDKNFEDRISAYRAASQNASKTLTVDNRYSFPGARHPVNVRVVTASRNLIPNHGIPNPFAADHQPKGEDKSENAASISLLFDFGPFRYITCGDLTWDLEAKLVTPNNPLGQVDLFMVTHHGLGVSNNPVFVKAIDPSVSVMCNGATKGGDPNVIKTVQSCQSFKALYQLHRNIRLPDDQQTPAAFIANLADSVNCKGEWIKVSVAPDALSYTVQIGAAGTPTTYLTRQNKNR